LKRYIKEYVAEKQAAKQAVPFKFSKGTYVLKWIRRKTIQNALRFKPSFVTHCTEGWK